MTSAFLKFEGEIIAWRIIRRIYSDKMAKDGILYISRILSVVD